MIPATKNIPVPVSRPACVSLCKPAPQYINTYILPTEKKWSFWTQWWHKVHHTHWHVHACIWGHHKRSYQSSYNYDSLWYNRHHFVTKEKKQQRRTPHRALINLVLQCLTTFRVWCIWFQLRVAVIARDELMSLSLWYSAKEQYRLFGHVL